MDEPEMDELSGRIYDIVIEIATGTVLAGTGEVSISGKKPGFCLLSGQLHVLARRKDMENDPSKPAL